ncbi:undecaprenyl-phosphate N-acetylglucosaminyl 1-phosphate transferase [Gracilibacillus boraciitolerans JCM 21714]|uniref:Undecaprenyl-phosphate N-acetylglucosaminyl 1-phosphate transferase n=1 Tax=Gracilibacillus boraciitolerans JCM 21714 TaxID=1298598 RepID=W4VGE8_9BACI|nr:undecaprenyl-phosphate N-acetylglucosaminyl 1-phosphate transferase [Gracilibacillus boraciitolerans JCM 21714]
MIGQLAAAGVVISSGLVIDRLTMPFIGSVELNQFGFLLTIIWIIGVTNAINLIDGLDGLASGVSAIGLTSILIIAIMDYRLIVVYLCIVLVGSCLGFLYHNFHPATIFMGGDTGALFLGYAISVISMLGLFKNVALFSFIIPIIVIAVPIFDTLFVMMKRLINKEGGSEMLIASIFITDYLIWATVIGRRY